MTRSQMRRRTKMQRSNDSYRERIRSDGYLRGLKQAYALVRRARLHQAALARRASETGVPMPWPHGMENWTEHAANVLHALGLRMQELIKEAKEGK